MITLSLEKYIYKRGVLFMAKKRLFGNEIKPRCEYCTHGKINSTGDKVGCDKKGLVNADFSCKLFNYSPLKRIPSKQIKMSAEAAETAAQKAAEKAAAAEMAEKEAQEAAKAAEEAAEAAVAEIEEAQEEDIEEVQDIIKDSADEAQEAVEEAAEAIEAASDIAVPDMDDLLKQVEASFDAVAPEETNAEDSQEATV